MTDFFYSLPIWLATILVLAVALAIGLGVSIGIQRLFRIKSSAEEKEVAVNLMQVVAAYVGIMIAFAGVQVWQDFSDAKAAVAQEAAAASQLYQDLTIFGAETRPARSRRPSVASRLSISRSVSYAVVRLTLGVTPIYPRRSAGRRRACA